MSINWVMLSEREKFVRLPGERLLYTSPERTALSVKTPSSYPGSQPFSISSGSGVLYLTNQRAQVVYLPQSPTPALQSFSAPVLNLHNTHVSAPFFGPNAWAAALQPVSGGGLPPIQTIYEVKITFKDGGAFDYHTNYERIKERLQQAVQVAQANGQMSGDGIESVAGRGGGALSQINMAAVDLEDLPVYQAIDSGRPSAGSPQSSAIHPAAADTLAPSHTQMLDPRATENGATSLQTAPSDTDFDQPSEPPPGYEEAQRESVANEMERLTDGVQSSPRSQR
ncbi:MAG: hypothetical protein M4579_001009 [Chaenotheca gracillima]|nr:MAG: hypothetical protein M4579_001009 [Chaenotheca gracillima]